MSENGYVPRPLRTAVGDHVGGGTPPRQVTSYWKGDIAWASVKDFPGHAGVITDTQEHISAAGLNASASNLIPAGTPLVCTRMAVGRAAMPSVTIAINQDVKALFPAAGVSPAYLLKLLQFIQPKAEAQAVGSTVKGIRIQDYLDISVPIADTNAQRIIAVVLDTLDIAIHETEAIIAKLKAVKQGLLHDLLTRGIDANGELRPPQAEAPHCYKESPLGWIPKEWHCSRLEKTCSRIGDGVHYAVKRSHEGVPFLFVSSIRDGRINWCDAAFVSRKTYQEISKRARPTTGMVLFTVVGSYGHAAHVDDDHEFGFERNIAFVIPDKRSLVSRYLFHFLTSTLAHSQVEKLVIGNAQKVLTLSALGSIVATTPATCEQDEICLRIDSITERQRSEEAGLEKLHYEKSGLMDDLLTGRVRVTPLLEATAP